MGINVSIGDAKVDYSTYSYTVWTDAVEPVAISTADPSNPRINRIVGYVDRGVTPSSVATNNPGLLKFMTIAGTPAASPVRPSNVTVQAAVGASNPYFDIADVLVGTGVTQITTANITDTRLMISVGANTVNTAAYQDGSIPTVAHAAASVTPTQWTNPYCFRAYATGVTTLVDNTDTLIALATEQYDYNNNFASNAYTIPVAGVYHFDGHVSMTPSATSVTAVAIIKVGGTNILTGTQLPASGTSNTGWVVGGDILLAAGDIISLWMYQDSAGNESINTGFEQTYLSGHLVRRTP